MKIVGVIPARMGSSRFPGKPLAPICGRSMIEHVYRRSALCKSLDILAVATPDREIAEAVEAFGGTVIMTSPSHKRATDRVAEAAESTGGDIVIVIQGDEPLIHPEMIDAATAPVAADDSVFCSNLIEPIESVEEFESPNTIKVTMDHDRNALYFSRSPIPSLYRHDFRGAPAFKQVCIIPFRHDALRKFVAMEPTPLEEVESIDMLRVLQHGHTVRLVETKYRTLAVDEADEIHAVERVMEADSLFQLY